MDCTDIKVLLSGLIDGEVDEPTRYAAERHLAECAPCRGVVDEAETLHQLMTVEADLASEPVAVPDDLVSAVLRRTVRADGVAPTSGHWMNWLGWFAAAAALALAATIWLLDLNAGSTGGPRVAGPGVVRDTAPMGVHNAGLLVSSILEDGAAAAPSPHNEASLQRDDIEALDQAALLLQMLDGGDADDLAMIRKVAAYDELVPRLDATLARLDARDRPAALASAMILSALLDPDAGPERLQELRDRARASRLSGQLSGITGRWDWTAWSL